MTSDRLASNLALYEVQVWNVDSMTAEWSILTRAVGLGSSIDKAEEFLLACPEDDDLRMVVAHRA